MILRRSSRGLLSVCFLMGLLECGSQTMGVGLTRTVAAEDSVTPKRAARKFTVLQDEVYAEHTGQKLMCDVYLPVDDIGVDDHLLRPAVVVVHGGAWSSGSKWTMAGYARKLAEDGVVAVAIDYRHAPAFRFPSQVDDVRAALHWVNQQTDRFRVDADRIGLFGYSAGGHLACLIGTLQDEPFAAVCETSDWPENDARWGELPGVLAVCAGAPPCDFREWPADSRSLAHFLKGTRRAEPHLYTVASPANYVSAGDSATLFIHGDRDFIVPIENSLRMFDQQRAHGVASEMVTVQRHGHLTTFVHPETMASMIDFFRRKFEL